MKRIIPAIIVLLLVFTVSCASEPESAEVFDSTFEMEDGAVDLQGFDFKIQMYEYFSLAEESVLSYQKDSTFYDLAVQRIHDIEKNYNCKITTENMSGGGLPGEYTPTIMAGIYFSDAILLGWYDLRPYVESKMFEPLTEVSDIIDYTNSKKWGTPNYLEWVVWDGNLYGVMPVLWPEFYLTSFGHMFVFNEQFAKQLIQPDPREYVETNTWNRDQLGNMMETYTFTEGDREVKALGQYSGHFIDQALRSNNAQAYKYVNGQFVSGYHTPEGQDALEWASDFLNVKYKRGIIHTTDDSSNYKNLIQGNTAMLLTYTAYIYGSRAPLSFELEDYCVLPFPNGPAREGQGYIGTFESVRNTLMFPLNGHGFESSAIICDALFEQLGDYDEETLKDYYLRYYFHDERDYDVFFEVAQNTRYSYYADGFRPKITEVLVAGNKSVTELLDSTKEYYNNLVAEKVVPTASSMADLFPGYDGIIQ